MLQFRHNLYYQSSLLEGYTGIIHGYSTRALGDMRQQTKRASFLATLGVANHTLIMPQQVHGNVVETVTKASITSIPMADGLVLGTKNNPNAIAIGIIVADCVPLLLADKKGKSIGVVHAGWKGSLKKIAVTVINQMDALGTRTEDIVASIGPHIGMCCYEVSEDRVRQFLSVFGDDPRIACFIEGTWHMDIGYINKLQLRNAGVPIENIDSPVTCTSCQNDSFYSYRKDTKETFGEIMAVIASAV